MSVGYRFPPLKWLMSFEATARHLSFTAAAQDLGLSQAAVSDQIKCLEGMLGAPLFERRPGNLQLTEIGHAYLPAIRRTFDELFASSAGLFGQIGQNVVNLRAAIFFMLLCLTDRLSALELLGKHRGMFSDRARHDANDELLAIGRALCLGAGRIGPGNRDPRPLEGW